jgi:hypothetical protein
MNDKNALAAKWDAGQIADLPGQPFIVTVRTADWARLARGL